MTTRFYNGDTGNDVHCWDDSNANNPDSDPAWRGDFKGLADKLDYIKALGFNAIWVTPVVTNASGYDYHGYHAMDFGTVDYRYESDDFDYQDLIHAVHQKGMKIYQDMMFNDQIHDAAKAAGKPNFLMFGEICTRYTEVWYRGHAEESAPYYTWKESNSKWANSWHWGTTAEDINANMNLTFDHYKTEDNPSSQPTSTNATLSGVTYHKPDRSKASGMEAIDFTMHRMFGSASSAFGVAKASDKYYNDATYNVMYVDSHDYAPEQPDEFTRFTGGTQTWAENLDLMFTFRGIPCVYYGSEVEFKKGELIDKGTLISLENSGRAYYGDYLEGDVTATDFSKYTASGTVATTLNKPLAQHLMKLNAIRRAVPALQKGQYAVASGNIAYIRRYTDSSTDSLACVTISGGATFNNVPNGKYIDAVTGDVVNVTNNTLTVPSIGAANMRVYVCCATGFKGISGKIGNTTTYLK